MTTITERLHATLGRVRGLHSDFYTPVADALDAAGLLPGGSIKAAASDLLAVSMAAAADQRRTQAQRLAVAEAKRLGVHISDGAIDLIELNRVLAGKDPTRRIAIKSMLAQAGLID
jgi:hypothetical protein